MSSFFEMAKLIVKMHLKHTEVDRHTSGKHKSSVGPSGTRTRDCLLACFLHERRAPFSHASCFFFRFPLHAAAARQFWPLSVADTTWLPTANAQRSYILFLCELHTTHGYLGQQYGLLG